jgi:hypothetical protein
VPALPPVAGVIRLQFRQTLDEDLDILNHLYVSYSAAVPNVAALITLGNDFATAWTANVKPLQTGAVTLTNIHLEDLASATGAVADAAVSIAGSRAGVQLPAATCAVINHRIARRYRGGKPKVFLVCGAVADIADHQSWLPAFVASVANAWDTFITSQNGVNIGGLIIGQPVSVSYFQGFTTVVNPITNRTRNPVKLRPGGPVVDNVIGVQVNSHFGSQRRRNELRG